MPQAKQSTAGVTQHIFDVEIMKLTIEVFIFCFLQNVEKLRKINK